MGEFTALTFLPLLVYGLYAVLVGNQKDWPCLVAGATGLLQSHILTTEWMAFVSALTVLVFIRQIFTKEKRVLSLVYAGVATVCLNLWFIAPMLLMIISIHPVVFTRVQSPIGFAKYDISYLFHTVTLTGMGPHPIGWLHWRLLRDICCIAFWFVMQRINKNNCALEMYWLYFVWYQQ